MVILEAIRYRIEQLLYLLSIGKLRFGFCDLKHRKSLQLRVTFPYSFQVQKEFIIVPSAQLHISELLNSQFLYLEVRGIMRNKM